jgi:hypothetical protein
MLGFKRLLVALALSSAFACLGSAPALAAGNPGRQPSPAPDMTGSWCGDAVGPILEHAIVNREYLKVYVSADGTERDMVEGFLDTQLTVLATGKTLLVNSSGPGSITFSGDSVTFVTQGHTLWSNDGPLMTGIWLFTGLVTWDTYPPTVHGSTTDICAELR